MKFHHLIRSHIFFSGNKCSWTEVMSSPGVDQYFSDWGVGNTSFLKLNTIMVANCVISELLHKQMRCNKGATVSARLGSFLVLFSFWLTIFHIYSSVAQDRNARIQKYYPRVLMTVPVSANESAGIDASIDLYTVYRWRELQIWIQILSHMTFKLSLRNRLSANNKSCFKCWWFSQHCFLTSTHCQDHVELKLRGWDFILPFQCKEHFAFIFCSAS